MTRRGKIQTCAHHQSNVVVTLVQLMETAEELERERAEVSTQKQSIMQWLFDSEEYFFFSEWGHSFAHCRGSQFQRIGGNASFLQSFNIHSKQGITPAQKRAH